MSCLMIPYHFYEQPEERHESRVEMLKSALDRNHSSSGGTGGLATQQYVQKSKSLLLKSGERVERLPLTTFATANGAHLGNLGNAANGGGEGFDADDALFAEMDVSNALTPHCHFFVEDIFWRRQQFPRFT